VICVYDDIHLLFYLSIVIHLHCVEYPFTKIIVSFMTPNTIVSSRTFTYCRKLRRSSRTVVYSEDLYLMSYTPRTFTWCRILRGPLLDLVSLDDNCLQSYSTMAITYCRILLGHTLTAVFYEKKVCLLQVHWLTDVSSEVIYFLSYPPRKFTYCRILRGGPRWISPWPCGLSRRTATWPGILGQSSFCSWWKTLLCLK